MSKARGLAQMARNDRRAECENWRGKDLMRKGTGK